MKYFNYLVVAFFSLSIFLSCSKSDDELVEVILTVDKATALADGKDVITLKLMTAMGEDVTSSAVFFQGENKLDKYMFSTDKTGILYFSAEYLDEKSNMVSVLFEEPKGGGDKKEKKYLKNVLVEDYTADWCQYCPLIALGLEEVKKANPRVVVVAVHAQNDRYMPFNKANLLMDRFDIQGYPTAMISKKSKTSSWSKANNLIKNYLAISSCPIGIDIKTEYKGTELSAEVNVNVGSEISSQMKLVVYVVENGIVASQSNYYNKDQSVPSLYQKGDPIVDFEHNHVLRTNLTDLFGDKIPKEKNVTGEVFTKAFKYQVLEEYNKDNMELVVFVVKEFGRLVEVVNVQHVKFGESKEAEEVE